MRPNQWALGAFSDSTGYPSVTEIHDGRVILGKTTAEPDTVHFSASGGYDTTSFDFQTTDTDGQVYDDLGFNVNISGGDASPIQWVSSTSDGVAVGTYSSEGIIGANDRSKGFAPGNVSYRRNTSVGSKSIQPVLVDQSTLFVSRTGRRLHELTYDITSTSQKSPDLTQIAEHVTKTGIIDFAFQREPRDTLWCVLTDGKLIGFTFDKNNEITAWHQHEIGGEVLDYNTASTIASLSENEKPTFASAVRSVATTPSPDGSRDDVWISVDRPAYMFNTGNQTDRTTYDLTISSTIEIIGDIYDEDTNIKDAGHIDSYLSISSTKTESVDVTSSGVIAPTLTDGQIYLLTDVIPTGTLLVDVENHYFRYNSNQFFNLSGGVVDFGSSFECSHQPVFSTFTGADVWLGRTVSLYGDGRYLGTQTIDPVLGVVTINNSKYCANLTIGIPYTSYVELQNLEAGDSRGITQGMIKKVNKVMVRVLNSLGLKYGPTEAELQEYEFDYDKDISEYRDLKSEDVILDWDEGYEQSGTLRFQGDGPYPLMIQSVTAEMETKGFSSNR